jgi:hypothetical protein
VTPMVLQIQMSGFCASLRFHRKWNFGYDAWRGSAGERWNTFGFGLVTIIIHRSGK